MISVTQNEQLGISVTGGTRFVQDLGKELDFGLFIIKIFKGLLAEKDGEI